MSKLLEILKDKVQELEVNSKLFEIKESDIEFQILQEIYNYKKGGLLDTILIIDTLAKADTKKRERLYYTAIEDSLGVNGILGRDILEFKSSREAKEFAKYTFEDNGISLIINACKAYFPDGNSTGAASATKWVLDKLKEYLKDHSSQYLKGGSSHNWVVNNGHLEYIKILLEEIKK